MILTPLGKIKVHTDDAVFEYAVIIHTYNREPVKGHPIDGCYRIRIPVDFRRSIRCEVELIDAAIQNTGASGERYTDAEFIYGTLILTIGAEDENPAFETVRIKRGVEYRIHGPIAEVVFGIAWATDYEGPSDCRTWYAADPTLDQ